MLGRPWSKVRAWPHSRRFNHQLRPQIADTRWPGYGVVIGIEVHAQIKSREKLFSNTCISNLDEAPNTHVSPYDAAFPGTLPRLNPKCVELGIRTAIALNARVNRRSAFDRKHYFYHDLPSGYQVTQHYAPFASDGILRLSKNDTTVRIKQIQLEQDTGKSTTDTRRRVSYVDLNRAGTALMEIVSEPDLRSPEEAGDYVRTLQSLLRSVGSSDGNMEQGSLRCDVNVSVNRLEEPYGTRCEIKNLNSVKFAMVAITSEVLRQTALLESGRSVPQETRGFDEDKAETYALRSKEDAPEYRYMPDPNLPPLLLEEDYISKIRGNMPELPEATRARLQKLGLSQRDADVLMAIDSGREVGHDGKLGQGAVSYFDTVAQGRDPKVVVNWVTHELLGQLSHRRESFNDNPLSAAQMGDLIDLVQGKKITGTSGKTILRHILEHRSSNMPTVLAKDLSLLPANDTDAAVQKWCDEAIETLKEEAQAVRDGNVNVVNKLVGFVMKQSRGTADAKVARSILQSKLSSQP